MYRPVFVALILFVICSQGLRAQVDSTERIVLSGTILDDSLGIVIPFAHLWNERSRMGSISSDSGRFSIKIRSQDTIYFSALGYYNEKILVIDSAEYQYVAVRLRPKKYVINEVIVRRFGSYESFKQEVLNYRVPETQTDYLREHLHMSAATAALEADRERIIKDKMNGGNSGFGFTSPLGAGVNREKERMAKLRELKRRQYIINQKFNRELVANITKLHGDTLTQFIAYCDFSEEYLYRTNSFSIVEAIYQKFSAYQTSVDTLSYVQ